MTTTFMGHHRNHRSGGTLKRQSYQIFLNAFHGKLGEWCLYEYLSNTSIYFCTVPDMGVYTEGIWDSGDMRVTSIRDSLERIVAIKTTKAIGNLLLLETQDWTENGIYKPSLETQNQYIPNRFVLVRINPFLKDNDINIKSFINNKNFDELLSYILKECWKYDIPGFITNKDFQYLVQQKYIIPQKYKLGGQIPMDAENYYIASKYLRTIINKNERSKNDRR